MEELAIYLGVPTTQVTTHVAKVLQVATDPAPREELQGAMDLQNREHFSQTYLASLIELNDTLAA
ncbi:MAG: hypothetical protein RIS76_4027 [Verrucomicrobiota bacterium]